MSICILSGRVARNATTRGTKPGTLSFILETRYEVGGDEKKERVSFVPCILFNPTPEVEALLTTEGEGQFVEFKGRVSGCNPDSNTGRRFSTEVIVRNWTLAFTEAPALSR